MGKCEADFYALWCDTCNLHPANCPRKVPDQKATLHVEQLSTRVSLIWEFDNKPDADGEFARLTEALRSGGMRLTVDVSKRDG